MFSELYTLYFEGHVSTLNKSLFPDRSFCDDPRIPNNTFQKSSKNYEKNSKPKLIHIRYNLNDLLVYLLQTSFLRDVPPRIPLRK